MNIHGGNRIIVTAYVDCTRRLPGSMYAKFQILKFHTLKFRPKFLQNFVTTILYIETSNVRMSRQNLPAKNMASRQDILAGDTIKSTITHHTISHGLAKPRLLPAGLKPMHPTLPFTTGLPSLFSPCVPLDL
jgi:hypothetical protein